jgi:hypothetical protein
MTSVCLDKRTLENTSLEDSVEAGNPGTLFAKQNLPNDASL